MLIFQLHLPHVIPNSMQALHALNHSEITFWKSISTCKFEVTDETTAFPKEGLLLSRILVIKLLKCSFRGPRVEYLILRLLTIELAASLIECGLCVYSCLLQTNSYSSSNSTTGHWIMFPSP